MKIIIEFDSKAEHDAYVNAHRSSKIDHSDELIIPTIKGSPIEDHTRRKGWSEYELEILRANYQTKKIAWIAKQLRRRPNDLYQKLHMMYKLGLPKRRPSSGPVR